MIQDFGPGLGWISPAGSKVFVKQATVACRITTLSGFSRRRYFELKLVADQRRICFPSTEKFLQRFVGHFMLVEIFRPRKCIKFETSFLFIVFSAGSGVVSERSELKTARRFFGAVFEDCGGILFGGLASDCRLFLVEIGVGIFCCALFLDEWSRKLAF